MKVFLFLCIILLGLSGCLRETVIYNSPRNVRGVVSYKRAFNDDNELQLTAARKLGITPMEKRAQAPYMTGRLQEVHSCEEYKLDKLTHSIPWLVPQAHRLLERIAQNFQDSLQSKGLNPYRIVVTSVLRTDEDIMALRKVNGNATKNSAHSYGTTFDISYRRFELCDAPWGSRYEEVRPDTLKMVLAEVLRDLRKAEACYVKHEVKQTCFHITTRGKI